MLYVEADTPGVIGLRYGGCSHHGLDDGTTLRTLTPDAVAPFVVGPNQVHEWVGE